MDGIFCAEKSSWQMIGRASEKSVICTVTIINLNELILNQIVGVYVILY